MHIMSNVIPLRPTQPVVPSENQPISQGVEHGPFFEGAPENCLMLNLAISEALNDGRISQENHDILQAGARKQMVEGIQKLKEYRETLGTSDAKTTASGADYKRGKDNVIRVQFDS